MAVIDIRLTLVSFGIDEESSRTSPTSNISLSQIRRIIRTIFHRSISSQTSIFISRVNEAIIADITLVRDRRVKSTVLLLSTRLANIGLLIKLSFASLASPTVIKFPAISLIISHTLNIVVNRLVKVLTSLAIFDISIGKEISFLTISNSLSADLNSIHSSQFIIIFASLAFIFVSEISRASANGFSLGAFIGRIFIKRTSTSQTRVLFSIGPISQFASINRSHRLAFRARILVSICTYFASAQSRVLFAVDDSRVRIDHTGKIISFI